MNVPGKWIFKVPGITKPGAMPRECRDRIIVPGAPMIRVALLALLVPILTAQTPSKALPPTEEATIQRFRAHAKPRGVAPRAPLTPEERNTIRRFRETKPSVVYISAFLPNPTPSNPPTSSPAAFPRLCSGLRWRSANRPG